MIVCLILMVVVAANSYRSYRSILRIEQLTKDNQATDSRIVTPANH